MPVEQQPQDPSPSSVKPHPTGYVKAESPMKGGAPPGAYPSSAFYTNYPDAAEPRRPLDSERSSTSSDPFRHPRTTSTEKISRNEAGVGESAAVRFREAPGEMGGRGGGDGGLGLMDEAGTRGGEGGREGNFAPDDPRVTERWAKKGLKEAWKERR
jgi:hypothetical protein